MTTETKPLNVEIFKLAGAKRRDVKHGPLYGFYLPDGKFVGVDIFQFPAIDENCQLMLDWLVPIMRELGYEYHISMSGDFWWRTGGILKKHSIIENDNVALAACEAAKPILEERAKEKG